MEKATNVKDLYDILYVLIDELRTLPDGATRSTEVEVDGNKQKITLTKNDGDYIIVKIDGAGKLIWYNLYELAYFYETTGYEDIIDLGRACLEIAESKDVLAYKDENDSHVDIIRQYLYTFLDYSSQADEEQLKVWVYTDSNLDFCSHRFESRMNVKILTTVGSIEMYYEANPNGEGGVLEVYLEDLPISRLVGTYTHPCDNEEECLTELAKKIDSELRSYYG